jgi:hypothetical protein
MVLSEAALISIITICAGICGLTIKMCLRSRCDTVELGCIKIHRNTAEEHDEAIRQPPSPPDLELNDIYTQNHRKITL